MLDLLETRSTVPSRDEFAPLSSLPKAQTPLGVLGGDPDSFVPFRLKELVDRKRIVATSYPYVEGHPFADNSYNVDLALIITEVQDSRYGEDPDQAQLYWNKVLEKQRQLALASGRIDYNQRPLLSLLAHSTNQMGVDVLSFIVAPNLRREGVGSEFYTLFEDKLRDNNYHYIGGDNLLTTDPKFYREGQERRPVSSLDPYVIKRLGLNTQGSRSIKFLNDYFESLVLAPKFER